MATEWTPDFVGRQLTLISHKLLTEIKLHEFENQAWIKPDKEQKSPNILRMIAFTNKVTDWLIYEILTEKDQKNRVKTIEWFLDLGLQIHSIMNLSSLLLKEQKAKKTESAEKEKPRKVADFLNDWMFDL